MKLEQNILDVARRIGFDLVGISHVEPSEYRQVVETWVAEKRHGDMQWYEKNIDRRVEPHRHLFGKAQSVIAVGLYYRPAEIPDELKQDKSRGLIARYAQYEDYHDVMERLLKRLARLIEQKIGKPFTYHCYVDTGPVLEREVASRGGLGFFGKNTTLINTTLGSYFFLGEIVSDLKLAASGSRIETNGTCGACTRCQVGCPTNAFLKPWQLDARRCISYLTIEYQGSIPIEFRPLISNRIYGCDICQEVCPWNKRAPEREVKGLHLRPELIAPKLLDLIKLSQDEFKEKFKGTPVLRATWRGFMRNVLVAIGNWGDSEALEAIKPFTKHDDELIREHAQWAIAKK